MSRKCKTFSGLGTRRFSDLLHRAATCREIIQTQLRVFGSTRVRGHRRNLVRQLLPPVKHHSAKAQADLTVIRSLAGLVRARWPARPIALQVAARGRAVGTAAHQPLLLATLVRMAKYFSAGGQRLSYARWWSNLDGGLGDCAHQYSC